MTTHTNLAAQEPLTTEVLADLITLHSRTSKGVWAQGTSSHHTVAKREGKDDYHVAHFHHADDASFIDNAHKYLPLLVDEISRLRAVLERYATPQPASEPDSAGALEIARLRGVLGEAQRALRRGDGEAAIDLMIERAYATQPAAKPAQAERVALKPLTDEQVDESVPGPNQFGEFQAPWSGSDMTILRATARAGIAKFCEVNGLTAPAGGEVSK